MPQVDSLVRNVVWNRLIDDQLGFNACVDQSIATGVYDAVAAKLVKNGWVLGKSAMFGLMTPEALEETSAITYPFVGVDVVNTVPGSGSSRWVVSATFAGSITFAVQVHLSWPDAAILPNFAAYGDLVQDAMHACLNNPTSVLIGDGLAYNGRLQMTRGPVRLGGRNWVQTLTFTGTFAAVVA